MAQDAPFVQECLKSGVVGSLCGAAKGAADLLTALDEVRDGHWFGRSDVFFNGVKCEIILEMAGGRRMARQFIAYCCVARILHIIQGA